MKQYELEYIVRGVATVRAKSWDEAEKIVDEGCWDDDRHLWDDYEVLDVVVMER